MCDLPYLKVFGHVWPSFIPTFSHNLPLIAVLCPCWPWCFIYTLTCTWSPQHVSGQPFLRHCVILLWNTAGADWHEWPLFSSTATFISSPFSSYSLFSSTHFLTLTPSTLKMIFRSTLSFPLQLELNWFVCTRALITWSIAAQLGSRSSTSSGRASCGFLSRSLMFYLLFSNWDYYFLFPPFFCKRRRQTSCPIPWDRAPKYDQNLTSLEWFRASCVLFVSLHERQNVLLRTSTLIWNTSVFYFPAHTWATRAKSKPICVRKSLSTKSFSHILPNSLQKIQTCISFLLLYFSSKHHVCCTIEIELRLLEASVSHSLSWNAFLFPVSRIITWLTKLI